MNDINWISIILATITPMLIGFIYYHKAVFGKAWTGTINMNDQNVKQVNKIVNLGVSILLSFLLSLFLLMFNNDGINQEGSFDNFAHGAWHGTFIAVTVVTPVIITNGFFGRRPWKYILINIFFWIITLPLMGGILDAMNHWENILIPE